MSTTLRVRQLSLRGGHATRLAARRALRVVPLLGHDFPAILLAGAVLVMLIVVGDLPAVLAIARIFLAIAFVGFIPGYVLLVALFPRQEDLDGPERVAVSIGASVVAVSGLAFILDRLGLGLRLWPILVAEYLLCGCLMGVAIWHRHRLGDEAAYAVRVPWQRFRWAEFPQGAERLTRVGTVLLALSAAVVVVAMFNPVSERFTALYVVSEERTAQHYPYQVTEGSEVRVVVGVVNEEGTEAEYRIALSLGADEPSRVTPWAYSSKPFTMDDGQAREQTVSWTMPEAGSNQEVKILLFKNEGQEPYRQLRLLVNVPERTDDG